MRSGVKGTISACELDDNGESSGVVYYFCSPACRYQYMTTDSEGARPILSAFDDGEPIEGTVCDQCGKEIEV